MRKATRVGMTFILAIGLSGCITADFKQPISDFTSSMSTANAAIGTYFTEMNNFEREVYLATALHDPKIKIDVINEQVRGCRGLASDGNCILIGNDECRLGVPKKLQLMHNNSLKYNDVIVSAFNRGPQSGLQGKRRLLNLVFTQLY